MDIITAALAADAVRRPRYGLRRLGALAVAALLVYFVLLPLAQGAVHLALGLLVDLHTFLVAQGWLPPLQ